MLLFIFVFVCSLPPTTTTTEATTMCTRTRTLVPRPSWRDWGGGQLIGGWGTRVWTSEKLAFHRKSSRLDRALTPRDAYQSKYIHSATDITSLHYGSSFLWFLLVLLCVLLFSPVIFGLTTASAPRLLRACVSLDSLANWELVPTGCTLS